MKRHIMELLADLALLALFVVGVNGLPAALNVPHFYLYFIGIAGIVIGFDGKRTKWIPIDKDGNEERPKKTTPRPESFRHYMMFRGYAFAAICAALGWYLCATVYLLGSLLLVSYEQKLQEKQDARG